ncbi:hypothetical protein DFA_08747 [Cavenderia fasciculata]|uniref:Uncharacterized protein n=1 Tax=Cavenderia fasciculata TaxID=261658 RepID=F4Q446_CACFS|nr:uncharacterized protein DFA_08747 [Cavenderia fasciculata]EGG17748.1 hypothetical protein DFA_08747 [Cavenderia fasciculata]|eukprot:XP_004356232.1 hypothetical protein DFA_08747 [Cavenderia fasciculata]
MNIKLSFFIILQLLSIYYVTAAPPSNIYSYTVDSTDTNFVMTVVNIATGAVNSTTLPIFQNGMWFDRFLGVDDNDNFLILVENKKGALGVATISPAGELLNAPVYAGPIATSYQWYYTSYQYDSGRDAVYFVVSGLRIFVYDLANSSTDIVQLSGMQDRFHNTPNGCFDGVDSYYVLDITDDNFSKFQLSRYSFADQKQHDTLNVTGIAPNSDTYLFCANKQVYALAYNIIDTTSLSLYLLDTDQASATLSYQVQDTGIQNSLNLWFSDNYFVLPILSSDNHYYLTTVDLNTNQVVSKTEVKGPFTSNPDISGVY